MRSFRGREVREGVRKGSGRMGTANAVVNINENLGYRGEPELAVGTR